MISAMGFYAVNPVSANYVFGTPLFDKVAIQLGEGHSLTLQAIRQSATDKYIDAVSFNGKPSSKLWFKHLDIERAVRSLSGANKQLGVSANNAPPSMALQQTS